MLADKFSFRYIDKYELNIAIRVADRPPAYFMVASGGVLSERYGHQNPKNKWPEDFGRTENKGTFSTE